MTIEDLAEAIARAREKSGSSRVFLDAPQRTRSAEKLNSSVQQFLVRLCLRALNDIKKQGGEKPGFDELAAAVELAVYELLPHLVLSSEYGDQRPSAKERALWLDDAGIRRRARHTAAFVLRIWRDDFTAIAAAAGRASKGHRGRGKTWDMQDLRVLAAALRREKTTKAAFELFVKARKKAYSRATLYAMKKAVETGAAKVAEHVWPSMQNAVDAVSRFANYLKTLSLRSDNLVFEGKRVWIARQERLSFDIYRV